MTDMPFADFLDLAGVPCLDGSLVTAKTMRLVETIRDYDSGLDVEWIPAERRMPDDDAIRVVDTRRHGLARTVMSFADEGEFTREDGVPVLQRLFLADHSKGDPMARMEARNAAAKALELKRHVERREEGRDLMLHALRSPLRRYTFTTPDGQRKRIDEGDPAGARPVTGPVVID